MESLAQEAVIHELLKCEWLPWAAVLYPSKDLSQGHRSLQHSCSSVRSSLRGFFGSRGPVRLLQCELPTVSHLLQECPPLYLCELRVDLCSTMTSTGCRTRLPHPDLTSFAPAAPRVAPLLIVNMCATCSYSFILATLVQQAVIFLPEEPQLPTMGSALGKSFSELAGTGPGQHGDNPWHLVPETLPGPLCYQALAMQLNSPRYVNLLI